MDLNGIQNGALSSSKSGESYTEISNKTTVKPLNQIDQIAYHFEKIMEVLGLDTNDQSLKDTPNRVAKMFVNESFKGLKKDNFPDITVFENNYGYEEMLLEKDITLYTYCEHHFVPIIGKVHVAYIPNKHVIGLSKINRLVEYYSKRPQVQERLTIEIANGLQEVLKTESVAVYIEADHLCVASRGIKDTNSVTSTSHFMGRFREKELRKEFLSSIR